MSVKEADMTVIPEQGELARKTERGLMTGVQTDKVNVSGVV